MANENDPAKPKPNGQTNGVHVHEGAEHEAAASDEVEREDAAEAAEREAREAAEAAELLEKAPPEVLELAASCVRYAMAKYKVPLDFTPDTLSVVDQYVRDSRGEVTAKPEAVELLAATIGAYLGEVLRRTFGGEWFVPPQKMGAPANHEAWRVDLSHVFLTFNPIGMAREALTREPADGWHAHLEMDEAQREEVEGRIAVLGAVDEDEFYLPTMRFEVLDVAVTTLRARMEAEGQGGVRFGAEDYRKR